jgi:DNA repair protein RadC
MAVTRGNLIREMAEDERPRERLLRSGGSALSDAELVAILLRTGRRGASAVEVARGLLEERGGLAALASSGYAAIRRSGLGPAKAATLLAALEVGRRLARGEVPERAPLTHPAAVARYLLLRFGVSDQEVMGTLLLDARNRLLAEREIYRGTLNRAAVEPRAILKEALLRGAGALILFHTHPSGDPSPSVEDLAFTRRLGQAAEAVGVRLADHLILGHGGRWLSLRERGGW